VRLIEHDLTAGFGTNAFDLVVEIYTLQVLPPELRHTAMDRLAGLVAPSGTLLVICRGRDPDDDPGAMPWPLTRAELDAFHVDHQPIRILGGE